MPNWMTRLVPPRIDLIVPETATPRALNRVLIIGTPSTGVFKLSQDFQDYLVQMGIPDSSVESVKNVFDIFPAFYNGQDPVSGPVNLAFIPKGVILLPYMRANGENGRRSLDTSKEPGVGQTVKNLCKRYDVPLVIVSPLATQENIELETRILLLGK